MLEKLNQAAEHAATNVSRRGFLGRFGRSVLAAAGAVGAMLTLPRDTSAGRPSGAMKCPKGYRKCISHTHTGSYFYCVPRGSSC